MGLDSCEQTFCLTLVVDPYDVLFDLTLVVLEVEV